MSLLRILRNLAVLVILTVGGLSLIPRPMAAQLSCRPVGASCPRPGITGYCCTLVCSQHYTCCLLGRRVCTSNAQCCNNFCNRGVCD